MRVKRGQNIYCYQSTRVNGHPQTLYLGKISTPQAQQFEAQQVEKRQQKTHEHEWAQLHDTVENVHKALHMMSRAYLLTIGLYQRRSELRKLKEETLCLPILKHTTLSQQNF
jgi:hypothetical protein